MIFSVTVTVVVRLYKNLLNMNKENAIEKKIQKKVENISSIF